jgi:hypothetical protein
MITLLQTKAATKNAGAATVTSEDVHYTVPALYVIASSAKTDVAQYSSFMVNRTLSASSDVAHYRSDVYLRDTVPDTYTFNAVAGAALSTSSVSNSITITGINAPANVSIVNGSYNVLASGNGYINSASSVANGAVISVLATTLTRVLIRY